jgi:hypothetical protein
VVALPVFLSSVLGWQFWQTGGFMAIWIVGYGIIQASTPALIRRRAGGVVVQPDGRTATWLAAIQSVIPAAIAVALWAGMPPSLTVPGGLILFGVVFALNSAVHSFLILSYTDHNKVAMNVGFYYMANACGRLTGTVLSGWLYQLGVKNGDLHGLTWCLWASAAFLILTTLASLFLPVRQVS